MRTLQTVKNSGFVGFASCQQNIQVKKMKSRTNKVITCFVLFTYMQSFTIVLTWAVNVFTFGGAKRSGSDRECKYFPIGMNAREPLWR